MNLGRETDEMIELEPLGDGTDGHPDHAIPPSTAREQAHFESLVPTLEDLEGPHTRPRAEHGLTAAQSRERIQARYGDAIEALGRV